MDSEKLLIYRPRDPFDDSASERLRRMGLLTSESSADLDAVAVISRVYAGLFFDDLCDFCDTLDNLRSVCRSLLELAETEESRRVFLAVCSQYDAMHRTLPEPVWWIAGNMAVVPPFIEGFMKRLAEFMEECEVV